ncbi:MAG: sterol carrier protein domain-containing protein, partial [Anaerolineales bacterium]
GDLVGLMLYDLRGEKVTNFTMRALRFYYRSGQGKYLLLQWISRHIDQAEEVEIWLPPYEHPGTWLADIRPSFEPAFFAPMGRILDVIDIKGMMVGAGRFSARINDPICPWNEGVWSFESQDGVLQIRKSDRPDCDLNVNGLAALVYGTHNPDEFNLRAWGNPPKAVQEVMREMFPSKIPHLHEMF